MFTNKLTNSQRSIASWLVGLPLETAAAPHQAISKKVGLAVFASDALSSTAYATQEILFILALAGTGAFRYSIPIALAIVGLLAIVTVSYRQTIHAYPNGGGAYVVARDNLGEFTAKVAAAALLTDYVLTVAVSIAAGVDQIVSALPGLIEWRVEIAVAFVLIMTVINLRGVKESGRILSIPTYLFLGVMLITLVCGYVRWMLGNLTPVANPPELIEGTLRSVTLFLILRAFSSGCTALTGVEAIANGIPAFREPRSQNAANTLLWMSIILGMIFLSITLLANRIGAVPSETDTIISQMGRTIFGGALGQWILLGATAVILVMAANTSFADFPRLAALAAADGFLPRQLSYRGSRLVFSSGIALLAGLAIVLLVALQANTSRLIPLYAIGVFLSFTLSQLGMVLRWRRVSELQQGEKRLSEHGMPLEYDANWKTKMWVNGVGGTLTAVVMLVFAITKFHDGAWLVIVLIPALVFIYSRIHQHYRSVADQLRLENVQLRPHVSPVHTLVLIADIHAGTMRLINFAQSLGVPWQPVHVAVDPDKAKRVQQKWREQVGIGELLLLPSPYRSISEPLRAYIQQIHVDEPHAFVHIIVGQLALPDFWEQALHRNSNLLIDLVLRDMDRVVITSAPYQIDQRERYLARLQEELDIEGIDFSETPRANSSFRS